MFVTWYDVNIYNYIWSVFHVYLRHMQMGCTHTRLASTHHSISTFLSVYSSLCVSLYFHARFGVPSILWQAKIRQEGWGKLKTSKHIWPLNILYSISITSSSHHLSQFHSCQLCWRDRKRLSKVVSTWRGSLRDKVWLLGWLIHNREISIMIALLWISISAGAALLLILRSFQCNKRKKKKKPIVLTNISI